MKSVNYKQGMTEVYVDAEKIVITNTAGREYIETNVDHIFGVGEFQKIYAVKYTDTEVAGKINPHARTVEIVSGYIPERALLDLELVEEEEKEIPEDQLPGLKAEDLIEEYFKK